jgi:ElaB/YqjD/DUF883 family membrane-anchored ribosome-binding protein
VDNELEVIRDEMEQTRASLAGKLEALESQVRDTVSGASEAVSTTVEGVKEVASSVSETVGSVTEALNVPKQVEAHPWAAMGIAVATGVAAGYLLSGSRKPEPPQPQPRPELPLQPVATIPSPPQAAAPPPPAPEEPGLFDKIIPDMTEVTKAAVTGVTGLAVGSLMGFVRDLVANGLPPEWKGELTNLVDQVTTKLGGKVMPPLGLKNDQPPPPSETEQDRLARLEELPSPLPDRPENVTQPRAESSPRPRRADRPQVARP